MLTQIPLRIARSPMHRQCLFQRRAPTTPRHIAAASRAFSSTPSRPYQKANRLVDIRMQTMAAETNIFGHPSPNIQSVNDHGEEELTDDVGLLQNTVIRASFSKLPKPTSWEFYSYFWTVLRARLSALYTRSHYKRCMHKKGIKSYMPVDMWKAPALKEEAKRMYQIHHTSLAACDVSALRDICMAPVLHALRLRIAARGYKKLHWQLHKFKSVRIASHRCAPVGETSPDTSYRQCIVRLESEQSLSVNGSHTPGSPRKQRVPRHGDRNWTPASAPEKKTKSLGAAKPEAEVEYDISQPETVVEYLVMQKRVVNGKEDEKWRLWGFADETTIAKMEEDETYWKNMLQYQATQA